MKSSAMSIFQKPGARSCAALAFALLCALAPCAAPADPPDPSRTPIPVGAPDFWPWSAAGEFTRDEYSATTLVIVLDGRLCATIPPQVTATDSLPRGLAILNRSYYDSMHRVGLQRDDTFSRHQVTVSGTDSSGRRSDVTFFTSRNGGLNSCSDLRGFR
jgi:hypothetical protein